MWPGSAACFRRSKADQPGAAQSDDARRAHATFQPCPHRAAGSCRLGGCSSARQNCAESGNVWIFKSLDILVKQALLTVNKFSRHLRANAGKMVGTRQRLLVPLTCLFKLLVDNLAAGFNTQITKLSVRRFSWATQLCLYFPMHQLGKRISSHTCKDASSRQLLGMSRECRLNSTTQRRAWRQTMRLWQVNWSMSSPS